MLCITVISHWLLDRVMIRFARPFLSGISFFNLLSDRVTRNVHSL
jgi:hypothetical protein